MTVWLQVKVRERRIPWYRKASSFVSVFWCTGCGSGLLCSKYITWQRHSICCPVQKLHVVCDLRRHWTWLVIPSTYRNNLSICGRRRRENMELTPAFRRRIWQQSDISTPSKEGTFHCVTPAWMTFNESAPVTIYCDSVTLILATTTTIIIIIIIITTIIVELFQEIVNLWNSTHTQKCLWSCDLMALYKSVYYYYY